MGEAKTTRLYDMVTTGAFPFLFPNQREGVPITVELYQMHEPETMLPVLDMVEGVPDLYTRETETFDNGTEGFLYVSNPSCRSFLSDPSYLITSGDWSDFLKAVNNYGQERD